MRRSTRSLSRALGALALAGALAMGGCGSTEEEPVRVAKEFARAAQFGNVKAMYELLDDETIAYLEASAEKASDQVGGRRKVEPTEMLRVLPDDRLAQISEAELVEQAEDRAVVRLTDTAGEEHHLRLVLQDGRWRVEIPRPPVEGAEAES